MDSSFCGSAPGRGLSRQLLHALGGLAQARGAPLYATVAGCGNNNTVTDKDTANNNPTSSGYQADEDGSVTSNGKTDTTDKTTTTTTKDNVKTDTKGVGDDVKSAADNVVDAADDVVDGAADAVEGVAEGAKDVVNGDDNTNTKTTANSSTKTTTTKGTTK